MMALETAKVIKFNHKSAEKLIYIIPILAKATTGLIPGLLILARPNLKICK